MGLTRPLTRTLTHGLTRILTQPAGGGAPTILFREDNGSVTIVSLAKAWAASISRQPNGSVTVSG